MQIIKKSVQLNHKISIFEKKENSDNLNPTPKLKNIWAAVIQRRISDILNSENLNDTKDSLNFVVNYRRGDPKISENDVIFYHNNFYNIRVVNRDDAEKKYDVINAIAINPSNHELNESYYDQIKTGGYFEKC